MSAEDEENFYPTGPWLISKGSGFSCKTDTGEIVDLDDQSIEKIKIVTNDRGPFEDDVFWKFEYDGGVCYFPSSADEDGSLLKYFQGLQGFDNDAVIRSMSSPDNAVFLVWDRNAL
jgi:hypothetical protein